MKAIIIDDIDSVAQLLKRMIGKYCTDVQVEGVANSAEEGEKLINETKPDIVFLDINMPGMGGFELLQSLDKIDFSVIFVTAFNEYAVKAIRFGAIDYLLKPIDPEELKSAVARAKEKIKSQKVEVKNLISNLKKPGDDSNTIVINSEKGLTFVKINEIISISADGNYSTVVTTNGDKYVSSKNLKVFEGFLEVYSFLRVHHSFLINPHFIKSFNQKNNAEITMVNGEVIPISMRKKHAFFEKFSKF